MGPTTIETEPNTIKVRTFNGYGESYEEPGHDDAHERPVYGDSHQGPVYGNSHQGPVYGDSLEGPVYGDAYGNEAPGHGQSNSNPEDEVEPEILDLSHKYKDSHDYHEYSKYL